MMQPTSGQNPLTAEKAVEIMQRGSVRLRDGVVLHVYKEERFSELQAVKTEELIGHDIVVLAVKGSITGDFGPSFVTEIAQKHGPAEFSWLVNAAGPLGKQLQRIIDRKQLPFWASVHEKVSASGMTYYTFDTPGVIVDAMPRQNSKSDADVTELEDLPF